MIAISRELLRRSEGHDQSKFADPEFSAYASVVDQFEKHPFGTEGYNKAKEKIKDAVQHHYDSSLHHPEHYKNGIDDMDLLSLTEMLCDWKAATLNHTHVKGNMEESIRLCSEKYKISPQLARILYNTAKNMHML